MREKFMISPESPFDHGDFMQLIDLFHKGGEVIDDRGRNLIKAIDFKGIKVNIKSFKQPHLINRVAYAYFRKSKAQRSFEFANILHQKGIGTPQPFAFFEYHSATGLKQSYFFSEHLAYDITYRELQPYPKIPDFEQIMREFTRFTFKIHEAGIYFKDHSAGNTLIIKDQDHYKFYLIDLNRMEFKELSFEDRIKNFAKLTTDKESIAIMADEYAKLIGKSPEEVHQRMLLETTLFREKYDRRMQAKKRYLNRDISADLEMHPNDIRIKDQHST